MSTSMRCQERFANNRAEVSHEHTREQERQMPRFQIATPGAVIRGCSQSGPQFVSHRAASSFKPPTVAYCEVALSPGGSRSRAPAERNSPAIVHQFCRRHTTAEPSLQRGAFSHVAGSRCSRFANRDSASVTNRSPSRRYKTQRVRTFSARRASS